MIRSGANLGSCLVFMYFLSQPLGYCAPFVSQHSFSCFKSRFLEPDLSRIIQVISFHFSFQSIKNFFISFSRVFKDSKLDFELLKFFQGLKSSFLSWKSIERLLNLKKMPFLVRMTSNTAVLEEKLKHKNLIVCDRKRKFGSPWTQLSCMEKQLAKKVWVWTEDRQMLRMMRRPLDLAAG